MKSWLSTYGRRTYISWQQKGDSIPLEKSWFFLIVQTGTDLNAEERRHSDDLQERHRALRQPHKTYSW